MIIIAFLSLLPTSLRLRGLYGTLCGTPWPAHRAPERATRAAHRRAARGRVGPAGQHYHGVPAHALLAAVALQNVVRDLYQTASGPRRTALDVLAASAW